MYIGYGKRKCAYYPRQKKKICMINVYIDKLQVVKKPKNSHTQKHYCLLINPRFARNQIVGSSHFYVFEKLNSLLAGVDISYCVSLIFYKGNTNFKYYDK